MPLPFSTFGVFEEMTSMEKEPHKIDFLALQSRQALSHTPRSEFIGGIFKRGYLSMLASKPGQGKSLLVQRLIYDLSIGGEVWGGFATSVPKRSLMLCGETSFDEIEERATLTKWRRDNENIIIYDRRNLRINHSRDLTLATDAGRQFLADAMAAIKPDILVIDSLGSFVTNESDREEMGRLFDFLEMLAYRENCAILVIHHFRKSKKSERHLSDSQDDLSGSGIMDRTINLSLKIQPVKDAVGNKTFTVEAMKQRNATIPPFAFTIQSGENEAGEEFLNLEFDLFPDMGGESSKKRLIWEAIKRNFEEGQTFQRKDLIAVCPASLVSPETIKKALPEFVSVGRLLRSGSNKYTSYERPRQRGNSLPK